MTTRTARCTYFRSCGAEVTSDVARKDRAFFSDKSAPQDGCAAPGTNAKGECGYTQGAHELAVAEPRRTYIKHLRDHAFVPQTQGDAHDEYYCGCRGWD